MPEAQAQVVIAFDFGLRRIGVACGNTLSEQATPHSAVLVGAQGIDWSAIDRLLQQYQPHVLVVGRPCNVDGTPGRMSGATDQFAQQLAARAGRSVHRTDEFASSIEASERLRTQRQSGQRPRRVQRADIDSAAAAIILERWFAGEGRADD